MLLALLTGCLGGDPDEVTDTTSATTVTPSLALGDTFLPFAPGVFGYARERGSLPQRDVFFNFGLFAQVVFPTLDITPHDDVPDHKMRVRLTLSDNDPLQNPSGDITVHGMIYERNWSAPFGGVQFSAPVSETLHFISNGTLTTSTYFDEVTSIETPGLGMTTDLEAELWDGHEQEMQVGVRIDGVTDQAACEADWRVYFNGQIALPEWDSVASICTAGLLPSGAHRGLYFGVARQDEEEDAFHHFINPGPDPTIASGHIDPGNTWQDWLASNPSRFFFDVDADATNETRIRPIVVQLERQSDELIVDAARMMLTIGTDAYGQPSLVAKLAAVENPGAIAQLSPHGLDVLEPTHASTLPYPVTDPGTQPRLSDRAIDHGDHVSPEVEVDLDALSAEDNALWTDAAAQPADGDFAGYSAYQDILQTARNQKLLFDFSMQACNSTPNPAACQTAVRATFCVENDPQENDFRIRITGVNTYFDPARPLDALVVNNVTGMDLSFGTNQILSDYTLEDIQGWLQASIDPANIQIEWDKGPLDLCTIEPGARPLSDYVTDPAAPPAWLTCTALSFTAASGTLAAPQAFDVVANGEAIDTPLASGTPTVNLAGVASATGDGICAESWLAQTIEDELLAWQADVEALIGAELADSPSQDEALKRLLSPYALGVARVDNPPTDTPPYDVHPLATYDLSARIDKTAADAYALKANANHGLYIPYLTRSAPTDADPFYVWFCPVINGQLCDDLDGIHEPPLLGGLDPAGDPYDVALNYTTAHINQALWAQARRQDRLGSPDFPARLTLTDTAIVDLATALGYTDVVDALTPLGTRFGVRYHQNGAPYTIITDGTGLVPPKLIYVIPNVVVELVSIATDGTETVVAKFLADVVDHDLQVKFSTGGIPTLTATWGDRTVLSLTATYVPNCYGSRTDPFSCGSKLRAVVGAFWLAQVNATLLDLIEEAPALQLFDAAGESARPRHLKNVRTFLVNEGLLLAGDLCKPGTIDCE